MEIARSLSPNVRYPSKAARVLEKAAFGGDENTSRDSKINKGATV
jgi:hypothetical protein